ncbi:MAG TPA: CRTAC1 family protein [Pseudobdellovibrionaceae bacterium]|nr:CRTAC1 family protein [Pseudobdellovibrionaceae bacterium]
MSKRQQQSDYPRLRDRANWPFWLVALTPFLALVLGKFTGAIPPQSDSYALGLAAASTQTHKSEPLFLDDTVSILGPPARPMEDFGPWSRRMPGFIVICDLDRDGWEDLISLHNEPTQFGKLRVYQSLKQGRQFKDVTSEWGLDQLLPADHRSTALACADLDGRGHPLLIVAGVGTPVLFFELQRQSVKSASPSRTVRFALIHQLNLYIEPRGMHVFDADGDGKLDLYFANYRDLEVPHRRERFLRRAMVTTFGTNQIRNTQAGRDRLFLNRSAAVSNSIKQSPNAASPHAHPPPLQWHEADPLPEASTTWAVGVSDFNRDGRWDIFLGQDFARDQLLINQGGGRFADQTKQHLGQLRSRNSMSAAIEDLDHNGVGDVYVTNKPKPGLMRGLNSLWMGQTKSESSGRTATESSTPAMALEGFRDEALQRGVDSCGWSWASQFLDFDHDGDFDLAVINGWFGFPKSDERHWYVFEFTAGLPTALLEFAGPEISRQLMRRDPRASVAAEQKKCLYEQDSTGHFVDRAEAIGFADSRIGRGLAYADLDQDGDLDLVMGGPYHGPILYRSQLTESGRNPGRWLSLKFVGRKSNIDGLGTIVEVKTSIRSFRRENQPLNGMQSQNSSRVFLTFQESERIESIQVIWPSGQTQTLGLPDQLGQAIEVIEP